MSRPRNYWDVAEIIEARIHDGTYPRGSQLPTQEELAEEFRIARGTISKAIAILKDRGMIISRPPVGVFVASLPEIEPEPAARPPDLNNPFAT